MKKLSFLLAILLCLGLKAFGQRTQDWTKYTETYPETFNNDSTQVGIVTCISERDDNLKNLVKENYTSIYYEVNRAAKEEHDRERSGNNTFVYLFGQTPAAFFVKNVNPTNAAEYEYRVTRTGDDANLPWRAIKKFDEPSFGTGMGIPGVMADLGDYSADYGQRITVEIRRKNSKEVISTAIAERVMLQPKVGRVFTIDHMNDFFNLLTHNMIDRSAPIPDISKLKSTENSLIFLLEGDIADGTQLDYELIKNGKVLVSWRHNDFDNNFIWLKNLPSGKYQLRFRYNQQSEHVGTCDFVIKPAWYQTTAIKVISGSLLAAFLGLIALVIVLLGQRRKATAEAERQKRVQMELQVIRAQLNPHFIFNSLSSIQSLVNKQDITGANNYLSEFSTLLRNTLENTELEQLPLEKEIKILDTYLSLEQLRFNFKYQIQVSEAINIYETEIPSLLLQPLLENAVKHGIADLKETGELSLSLNRAGNDMIVVIRDNGKGFDPSAATDGYGLKLVRKRIDLLNNVSKDNEIKLDIKSDQRSFNEIILTFINWFV